MKCVAASCAGLTFTCGTALVIASCANSIDRKELAERARSELVGMRTEQLLACAGAPDKRASQGSLEVLSYVVRKDTREVASFCEATFVLKNGSVTKVSYKGTLGLVTGHAHCGHVVENCLR